MSEPFYVERRLAPCYRSQAECEGWLPPTPDRPNCFTLRTFSGGVGRHWVCDTYSNRSCQDTATQPVTPSLQGDSTGHKQYPYVLSLLYVGANDPGIEERSEEMQHSKTVPLLTVWESTSLWLSLATQSPSQSPLPSPARARIDPSLGQIRSSMVVYQAFINYRSQRKEAKLLHRKATPVFSHLQRVIAISRTRPSRPQDLRQRE